MSTVSESQEMAVKALESNDTWEAVEEYLNGPKTELSKKILGERLDAIHAIQFQIRNDREQMDGPEGLDGDAA